MINSVSIPPYQGLQAQLKFEENIARKRIKNNKKTLSPSNARRFYLKNHSYMVIENINRNVFKKTKEEKQKLKLLKKRSTYLDGTR